MPDARIAGQLLFQVFDFRPHHVLPVIEHRRDGFLDLRSDSLLLCIKIDKLHLAEGSSLPVKGQLVCRYGNVAD